MGKRERRELIPPVSCNTRRVSFTVRATLVDSQATENRLKRQKELKISKALALEANHSEFRTERMVLRRAKPIYALGRSRAKPY